MQRACPSVRLFVCLSPNTKTRFSQKLSILEPYRPIGSRTWAFQRTHYWTLKIQDGGVSPSWILTPKRKNAIFSKTKQFRATVSIDDL